jgi:hypothetical protein
MINQEKQYFQTSELSLVAIMKLHGHQIEKMEKFGKKITFSFEPSDQLEKLVKDFWSHRLSVEPLAFFNSIREIKGLIYQNNY